MHTAKAIKDREMTEDGKDIEIDASNVEAHKEDSPQDSSLTSQTNSQLPS